MKRDPLVSRTDAVSLQTVSEKLRQFPPEKGQLHTIGNPGYGLVSPPAMTGSRRWRGEWTGEALGAAGLPIEGGCMDPTASPCPKLAEARAGRALAERQFVELNHRMANVLQMLLARIEWQRRIQDDRSARDGLERLAASIQASAELHQCLLPPRQHMDVDLGALLTKMAAAIAGVTGLRCDVEAEPIDLPGQVAAHLAAAVNELAWNAYKHAYRGRPGGVLRIVCRRDADSRLLLSVADQGSGLPPDFDPRVKDGLGLMLICATLREFGGRLRVESDQGACFILLLNIPQV